MEFRLVIRSVGLVQNSWLHFTNHYDTKTNSSQSWSLLRCLVTSSNSGHPSAPRLAAISHQPPTLLSLVSKLSHNQNQSQSYFTTGSLLPISSSWCQAPWGPLLWIGLTFVKCTYCTWLWGMPFLPWKRSVKVIIWNEEPLMGFEMCPWEQSHIYMQVLQLFIELIALPPNAICIICCDCEQPVTLTAILFH
jgi:hypothetical protein